MIFVLMQSTTAGAMSCEAVLAGPLSVWLASQNPQDKVTVRLKGKPKSDSRQFFKDASRYFETTKVQVDFKSDGVMVLKGIQSRMGQALRSAGQFFADDKVTWLDAPIEQEKVLADETQVQQSINYKRVSIYDFTKILGPTQSLLNMVNLDFQIVTRGSQPRWVAVRPDFFQKHSRAELISILEEKANANFSEDIQKFLLNDLQVDASQMHSGTNLNGAEGIALLNGALEQQIPLFVGLPDLIILPLSNENYSQSEMQAELLKQSIDFDYQPGSSVFNSNLKIEQVAQFNFNLAELEDIKQKIITNGDLAIRVSQDSYLMGYTPIRHLSPEGLRLKKDVVYRIGFLFNPSTNTITLKEFQLLQETQEASFWNFIAETHQTADTNVIYKNDQGISIQGQKYRKLRITAKIMVKLRIKHNLTAADIQFLMWNLITLHPNQIELWRNDGTYKVLYDVQSYYKIPNIRMVIFLHEGRLRLGSIYKALPLNKK